jgi:hypothetical protein
MGPTRRIMLRHAAAGLGIAIRRIPSSHPAAPYGRGLAYGRPAWKIRTVRTAPSWVTFAT